MISPERYEQLGRPEKILLAMGELSKNSTKSLSYEDIVVKSWQLFPQEFGLRNYADQYPDASDIHKPRLTIDRVMRQVTINLGGME
jgi:hypothetical protein